MTWTLDGRPLRRVLVTRLRYLGDVVMSTVVADVLKAGDPELDVGFLCETAHGTVLEDHPSLDRLHRLSATRRGGDARVRSGTLADAGGGTLSTILGVRRQRYDLAVDLFFNPRSAWLLRLAGIPCRIGGAKGGRRRLYSHTVLRESVADPAAVLASRVPGGLGDHLCRLAPLRHEETGLPFLAWMARGEGPGAWRPMLPRLAAGPDERSLLAAAGLDGEAPYIVAAPAATWPSKEWPRGHWNVALAEMRNKTGRQVAIIAPPGSGGRWSGLKTDPAGGVAILEPRPLGPILHLLGGADGLVTVDGGVMHAAVAMGVPTVALFGPTDPDLWFPYEQDDTCRVLATRPPCHPCDLHTCDAFVCLPDLAPARVVDAVVAVCGEAS